MKTFRLYTLGLAGAILLHSAPVVAAVPVTPENRAALVDLARQFVTRVHKGFREADRYIDRIQPEDLRVQKYFARIPEGEPLLLQIKMGRALLPDLVTSIKKGDDVMISLSDFVTAASFAISIDAAAGKAAGWYAKETQKFALDAPARKVTLNDGTFDVAEGDVEVLDDDIFVKGQTLSKWMNFVLTTNVLSQNLDIVSAHRWPFQTKMDRLKKEQKALGAARPAKLPRQEEPYETVSLPNADVTLTDAFVKPGQGGQVSNVAGYSVQAAGDLAGHTVNTAFSGTDKTRLSSLRMTFSRQSEDPDLLGFLNARRYQFGDIRTVNVPFAGMAPSEMGARVSNKNPYATGGMTTTVSGEAPVGWDVELYRNNQYAGLFTVGPDGRYDFEDVLLFAGDNDFHIIQYGPHGEIRDEHQIYSVSPSAVGADKGVYDVSLSAQNTQIWSQTRSKDLDKNTPHLAATYEQQLLPNLSAHVGLQARQENLTQMYYGESGLVTNLWGAILNADAVYDSVGAYKTVLAGRRKFFGDQNTVFRISYDSPNYTPGMGIGEKPSVLSLSTVTSGPVPFLEKGDLGYSAGSSYTEQGTGDTVTNSNLQLSTMIDKISLSNFLNYSVSQSKDVTTKRANGAFAARSRVMGTLMRANVNYDIMPQSGINAYALYLSRNLARNLNGDMQIRHKIAPSYTSVSVGLDWMADHFTLAPSASYDTDRTFNFTVNMRFGLAKNPYGDDLIMSNKSLSGSGGISARVFLDKDGDNLFSPGDELLEGVTVSAVQTGQKADTDEDGEAFVYGVSTSKVTDVVVEENSTMDASWISGFPGVSVRARPGHVARIEFPMHVSGEIDGTVFASVSLGKPRALKNMHLRLYDGDGRLAKAGTTGSDGYYLIDRIPPGRYYLIMDQGDAKRANISRPAPQEIKIGFEGTVISGNDIIADSGGRDIPVNVLADLSEYEALNPNMDRAAVKDHSIILNLGSYRSRLLSALVWYKLKMRYASILSDARLLALPSEGYASPLTGLNALRVVLPGFDTADAWRRCRALSSRSIYCAVELLPGGFSEKVSKEGPPPGDRPLRVVAEAKTKS